MGDNPTVNIEIVITGKPEPDLTNDETGKLTKDAHDAILDALIACGVEDIEIEEIRRSRQEGQEGLEGQGGSG